MEAFIAKPEVRHFTFVGLGFLILKQVRINLSLKSFTVRNGKHGQKETNSY